MASSSPIRVSSMESIGVEVVVVVVVVVVLVLVLLGRAWPLWQASQLLQRSSSSRFVR